MMWVAYLGLGFAVAMFVAVVGGIFVASVIDWRRARRDRVWTELQRTNYERRRPAAK